MAKYEEVCGCKSAFLPAVPPDDQYVLELEHSAFGTGINKHEIAPGIKSIRLGQHSF